MPLHHPMRPQRSLIRETQPIGRALGRRVQRVAFPYQPPVAQIVRCVAQQEKNRLGRGACPLHRRAEPDAAKLDRRVLRLDIQQREPTRNLPRGDGAHRPGHILGRRREIADIPGHCRNVRKRALPQIGPALVRPLRGAPKLRCMSDMQRLQHRVLPADRHPHRQWAGGCIDGGADGWGHWYLLIAGGAPLDVLKLE